MQPDIQIVRRPFLVLFRRERRRELVSLPSGNVFLGDSVQVRADLVGAALLERVALRAHLRKLLTVRDVGARQQRLDWLDSSCSRGGCSGSRGPAFGAGRQIGGLVQLMR